MPRVSEAFWSVKVAMTVVALLLSQINLGSLPSANNIKPFFTSRLVPILETLGRASCDDVVLDTRSQVLLYLFVYTLEGVARKAPESFSGQPISANLTGATNPHSASRQHRQYPFRRLSRNPQYLPSLRRQWAELPAR